MIDKILGYLGPEGTFSHEAALEFDKDKQYNYRAYASFRDAIIAVKNNEIHAAIVPIENSLEGAVNATLDVLAQEEGLLISAEYVLPVKLHLMAKPGTRLEDIKEILSYSQPLGQCRGYLNTNFAGVPQIEKSSTSKAAAKVASGVPGSAAIASGSAAQAYGLDILDSNIQDADNNHTRFVMVSKQYAPPTGRDKTSIVFSTQNTPGSLYRILDIFSLWDINMTRIESRPTKNLLGQYVFFIDIDGHIEEQDVADALKMIQRKTSFYRFLGSYPKTI